MKKTFIILMAVAFVGCKKGGGDDFAKEAAVKKTELMKKAETFFKSVSSLPANTIPQNKIDLGKKLYFDKALSKNGTISCNSCHNMETFGVDNKPQSPGDNGKLGVRNSPSVIYSSLHTMQFWDGRAKDVEEQAGGPILNPVEHGIPNKQFLENKLKAVPEYQKLFAEVFPNEKEPVTFANITNAIGAFERQLNPKSKFDDFLDGNDVALTDQEKKGLDTFITVGCTTCHSGVAVGGQIMQKLGLYGDFAATVKETKVDKGLFDLTKKQSDMFMFKSQSLRNIEKTQPYFHNGSVSSLKEAIKIMGKLQLNKDLTNDEISDIEAFLKSLTADVDAKYKKA